VNIFNNKQTLYLILYYLHKDFHKYLTFLQVLKLQTAGMYNRRRKIASLAVHHTLPRHLLLALTTDSTLCLKDI